MISQDRTRRFRGFRAAMIAAVWLWAGLACCAEPRPPAEPAPEDAARTAPAATTAPADEVSPEAMRILRALEAAGREHPRLRADLNYKVDMTLTGDQEIRTGWVAFQDETDKTPAKFRIHFETLQQGEKGSRIRAEVDYAYSGGQWLSVAKHRIKQLTHYQVASEGQKIEPLRLGKGPFPLPFGQRVEDVLKYFEVTTRPPKESDPKNTDYLKLVTRRHRRRETAFREMELWASRETHLPVKIVSRDKSRNITTVIFEDVRKVPEMEEDLFALERSWGWKERFMPLEKAGAPGQD